MKRCLRELTNEADIEWSCSKCDKDDVESKLSLFISKLPKILIIRLKPSVGYVMKVSFLYYYYFTSLKVAILQEEISCKLNEITLFYVIYYIINKSTYKPLIQIYKWKLNS